MSTINRASLPAPRFQIILFLALLIILLPGGAVAQSLSDYLTEDQILTLKEEGEITRYSMEEGLPTLVPEGSLGELLLEEAEELNPWVIIEGLFLIDNSAVRAERDPREELLYYYNILRSVSTMEGIDYYSASRDRYRLLFEESYYIDSPQDKEPLPDPSFTSIPRQDDQWLFQKDTTFGAGIYHHRYYSDGHSLMMTSVNHKTMRYYLIPMANPRNMMTLSLMIPTDEGLLFYGAALGKANRFFGIKIDKSDSLYNRVVAVKDWFCTEAGLPFERRIQDRH